MPPRVAYVASPFAAKANEGTMLDGIDFGAENQYFRTRGRAGGCGIEGLWTAEAVAPRPG